MLIVGDIPVMDWTTRLPWLAGLLLLGVTDLQMLGAVSMEDIAPLVALKGSAV
jgi:hypothetical protein